MVGKAAVHQLPLASAAAPEAPLPGPKGSVTAEDIRLVHQVIDAGRITMHFQPIVDLATGGVYAYEALCRSLEPHFASPQHLISAAVQAERIGELGRLQRQLAVRNCPGSRLFLNIEPNEFDHGWLVRPDDPLFKHPESVYIEITETVPLSFFEQCHSVLTELRKKGVLLAIDDLGAGFSNLKYISELRPAIVKLDRDLVAGTRLGTPEYELLRAITHLCREMGAAVVAEGVETENELRSVLEARIDYCQGYLLARPTEQPPAFTWGPGLPRLYPLAESGRMAEDEPPPEAAETGPEATETAPPSERERELRTLRKALDDSERIRRGQEEALERLRETPRPADSSPQVETAAEVSPEIATDPDTPPMESSGRKTRRELDLIAAGAVGTTAGLLLAFLLAWLGVLPVPGAERGASPAVVQRTPGTAGPLRLPVSDPVAAQTTATSVAPAKNLADEPAEEPADEPTAEPTTPGPAAEAPEPVPASPEPVPDLDLRDQTIQRLVENWAGAWAGHRVEEYVGSYSRHFEPPDGMSRGQWEALRRDRVGRPGPLEIDVTSLRTVELSRSEVGVRFIQTYESPTYRDQVEKTLFLVREDGGWRIVREVSEPLG